MLRHLTKEPFLAALFVVGLCMRLVWPGDMEWKTDEQLVYGLAQETAASGVFPVAGIKSGGGIVNPGMSVGLFALVAAFTDTPIGMVRFVQWANVLSLVGFLLLAFKRLTGTERDTWLLGLVLAAVNPLAVLFSRKIWAQDLLPLFALAIVLGHTYRHRNWGAFCWGITGALMGQVHMSGFFYAFGLFAVTVFHDRLNQRRFRWASWSAGSAIGALSLVPWLLMMINTPQTTTTSWVNILQLNFFFYWLIDPLGLDSMYSLREEFWMFLREPLLFGTPTFLVGGAHLLLLFITGVCVKGIHRYLRTIRDRVRRSGWLDILSGMSFTNVHFCGILLGLGVLMPLGGVTVYQHYLICAFPFAYVFIAKLLVAQRRVLYALLIAQVLITTSFLVYIHRNGGAPDGDYGATYRSQVVP